MAITPKLEIRQSQSLLMTPQLRQAINLLQMSNLELSDLLEHELSANPLLEREDDRLNEDTPQQPNIDDYDTPAPAADEEEFAPDIDYDNAFDDYGSDREGYEFTHENYDWSDYSRSKGASEEDFDFFEKKLSNDKSLFRFLEEQISQTFKSKVERAIAFALTEHLDPAGYFRGSIRDLSVRLNVRDEKIRNILDRMKNFEPSGIFAENLAECLQIQLRDKNRLDPQIQLLLDNLELLGSGKIKELKKKCQATDEDFASMLADIKALNPKPAAGYEHDLTTYVIPDVFVKTNKYGEYLIELNNMSLPRVLINREYFAKIKRQADKQTQRYLKEQLSSAGFLTKALHQRAVTILKVSEEIVRTQRDFFEKGIEHLRPMTLKDIAQNIEMHESTVSRVTANKYMHTPRGIFELKYFFSQAAGTLSGDDNTSTVSIKHKLKKLIDEENPDNILSDDRLTEILAASGIKIARRTIAKYRESMGIPSSGQRKREKRRQI